MSTTVIENSLWQWGATTAFQRLLADKKADTVGIALTNGVYYINYSLSHYVVGRLSFMNGVENRTKKVITYASAFFLTVFLGPRVLSVAGRKVALETFGKQAAASIALWAIHDFHANPAGRWW